MHRSTFGPMLAAIGLLACFNAHAAPRPEHATIVPLQAALDAVIHDRDYPATAPAPTLDDLKLAQDSGFVSDQRTAEAFRMAAGVMADHAIASGSVTFHGHPVMFAQNDPPPSAAPSPLPSPATFAPDPAPPASSLAPPAPSPAPAADNALLFKILTALLGALVLAAQAANYVSPSTPFGHALHVLARNGPRIRAAIVAFENTEPEPDDTAPPAPSPSAPRSAPRAVPGPNGDAGSIVADLAKKGGPLAALLLAFTLPMRAHADTLTAPTPAPATVSAPAPAVATSTATPAPAMNKAALLASFTAVWNDLENGNSAALAVDAPSLAAQLSTTGVPLDHGRMSLTLGPAIGMSLFSIEKGKITYPDFGGGGGQVIFNAWKASDGNFRLHFGVNELIGGGTIDGVPMSSSVTGIVLGFGGFEHVPLFTFGPAARCAFKDLPGQNRCSFTFTGNGAAMTAILTFG